MWSKIEFPVFGIFPYHYGGKKRTVHFSAKYSGYGSYLVRARAVPQMDRRNNDTMRLRTLTLAGALALCSLSLLGAKSYDITLSSPAKAGPLQLAAGQYNVKLQGTNAVFTNENNGEKFTAPVKVENKSTKFPYTAVEMTTSNGSQEVKAIELGGSTTELEFGN